MIRQLETVLALTELSGGAVPPPVTLALCATVRRYAGLVADLMVVIDRGEVLDGELDRLCDRAEACRQIDVP